MIYELHMRKRSKNVNDLKTGYLMRKELLERKLRHLYTL
jgi:hypothetical protein